VPGSREHPWQADLSIDEVIEQFDVTRE